MRYIEYHPLALRTESKSAHSNPREILNHRLNHAVLGFQSEFAELKEKKETPDWLEEFGDCFWYLNLACSAVGTEIDELVLDGLEPDMDSFDNFAIQVGLIADQVKRAIYYTTEDRIVEVDQEAVKKWLAQIRVELEQLCIDYDIDVEEVLEANIEKLSARYPDKFTSDYAIDRNIDREKKALRDLEDELPVPQKQNEIECEGCQ